MTELEAERLLRALVEHDVDFYVIGALAAWLQGNPGVTLDLDVMPRRDLENADRLAAALNSLGARDPGARQPAELEAADFLGWRSRRFDTEAGPIDVVPRAVSIGGFEDVATVEIALGDITVRVATIDEVMPRRRDWGGQRTQPPSRPSTRPARRFGRGARRAAEPQACFISAGFVDRRRAALRCQTAQERDVSATAAGVE